MDRQLPVWASIALVAVISALLLVSTHVITQQFAPPEGVIGKDSAQGAALPAAEQFVPVEISQDAGLDNAYEGQAGGQTVGYVAQATVDGYAGPIEVVVGLGMDGRMTGVSAGGDKFGETPGLGEKVKDAEFRDQFIGLVPLVSLGSGDSAVDSVSGATISSEAVVKGVNAGAQFLMTLLPEGATPMVAPVETEVAESAPAEAALDGASAQNVALPAAEQFVPVEISPDAGLDSVYEGQAGGQSVGYTAQITVGGYAGPIEVVVGMDMDGLLTGISVGGEDFAETPGLGAKAMDAEFRGQFVGLAPIVSIGSGDGASVDAISGATVTSEAVVTGVNQCAEFLKTLLPQGVFQQLTPAETQVAGDAPVEAEAQADGASIEAEAAESAPAETQAAADSAPIEAQAALDDASAQNVALPAAEQFVPVEISPDAGLDSVHEGQAGGQRVGYTAQINVGGYGGRIEVVVGMDMDGLLTGISVGGEDFAETPGFGAKAKDAEFRDQFVGLAPPVSLGSGDSSVDAISGATETSQAVVKGVNKCAEFLNTLISEQTAPAAAGAAGDVPAETEIDESVPAKAEAAEGAPAEAALDDASAQNVALPAAEQFVPVEISPDAGLDSVHEGQAGGQRVGYTAQINVGGYGGRIEVVVGMDMDGLLTGISVGGENFAETPGFGAKAKDTEFRDQFVGLAPPVSLGSGDSSVDAISGATETSQAVVKGVNKCAEFLKTLL